MTRHPRTFPLFLCAAALLGLTALPATAALIHANGQVWSLNTNAPPANYFPPSRASDGSTAATWVTNQGGADYFAGWPSGQPVLVMDLGADVTLNGAAFWNYSTSNANDTSAFSLRFATAAEGPLGAGKSIAYNPSFTPAYGGPAVQENLPFAQPVNARYVEMTVTDNFAGVNVPPVYPGGDRVGFAEIQFDAAAAPAYQAPVVRARPTATQNNSNPSDIIDGSTGQWYSNANGADYFATGGTPPVIVIDLGSQQKIDGFDFRNYSIIGNRLKDFSLQFATEGEGPGAFGSSIAYQPSFTVANQDQNQVQSLSLAQSVSARYVQMTLTDNYAEAGAGGDRVGFAEIQFRADRPSIGGYMPVRAVAAASTTDASDYYKVTRLLDDDPNTSWVSANEGTYFATRHAPILTFDLGKDTDLAGVLFRNYGAEGNGTKDFQLAFATEADGPNGFGTSIDLFPILHPLVETSIDQELFLPEFVHARYVQMLLLDNYAGWGYPGGDRVGFNDIQFLAVPEPATLALAGAALASLGGYLRRRRAAWRS